MRSPASTLKRITSGCSSMPAPHQIRRQHVVLEDPAEQTQKMANDKRCVVAAEPGHQQHHGFRRRGQSTESISNTAPMPASSSAYGAPVNDKNME